MGKEGMVWKWLMLLGAQDLEISSTECWQKSLVTD